MLTKEERMQLLEIKEDYLDKMYTMPELRDENPTLWHEIVDQWFLVEARLDEDEWKRIRSTCHD